MVYFRFCFTYILFLEHDRRMQSYSVILSKTYFIYLLIFISLNVYYFINICSTVTVKRFYVKGIPVVNIKHHLNCI